jgi:hypothetical protein
LIDRGVKAGTTATESAELAVARQRIRDLEEQVKILRKAAAAVHEVVPPKVRYRLVAELHDDGVRVGRSCHALGVSRSGYYTAPTRRMMAARFGKMPTTSVRRRISLLSRSFNRPS